MSGIIPASVGTGQNVYFTYMDMLTGQVWNGAALEIYNQSHWGNYAIAASEQAGSGRYIGTVPGTLPAGNYWLLPYLQIGGSPAVGVDTPLDILRLGWDGSNIVDINSGLNVGRINGLAAPAANLAVSANAFVIGAAVAGTLTTSQMTTNLAPANAFTNMYAGRVMIFTSGVNAGLAVLITAFVVTGGRLTFISYGNLPAPAAPGIGDTFIIQ